MKGWYQMANVIVERGSQITLIEESWWNGLMDGKDVAVHAKIWRMDSGPNVGKFAASAHLHSKGGRKLAMSGHSPDPSKFDWAETRDAAVDSALARLEARADVKFPS